MQNLPNCPECKSEYTYQDGSLVICPECAHEWNPQEEAASASSEEKVYRDAFGTELKDGDTVTLIKDLKVKSSSTVIKVGTKVKNIQLVDSDHDINCRVEGVGQMGLKTEFVKKA